MGEEQVLLACGAGDKWRACRRRRQQETALTGWLLLLLLLGVVLAAAFDLPRELPPPRAPGTAAAAELGGARQRIHVGCMLEYGPQANPYVLPAIRQAVWEVNSNPDILPDFTISPIFFNVSNDPFQAAAAALQLVSMSPVPLLLLGPPHSQQVQMVGPIATATKIPFITFSATDPLVNSNSQLPFFIRMCYDDTAQMAAIADLVALYGWKEVIGVFDNNDGGRNSMEVLGRLLALNGTARIGSLVAIDEVVDKVGVNTGLLSVRSLDASVFVLHMQIEHNLQFLLESAAKLGLFGDGYVWLATAATTTLINSQPKSSSLTSSCEGLVGLLPYTPPSPSLSSLLSALSPLPAGGNKTKKAAKTVAQVGLDALAAYDAVHFLSAALHNASSRFQNFSSLVAAAASLPGPRSIASVDKLWVSPVGDLLMPALKSQLMEGVTGSLSFVDDGDREEQMFVVTNLVRQGLRVLGYYRYLSDFTASRLSASAFSNSSLSTPSSVGLLTTDQMNSFRRSQVGTNSASSSQATPPPPFSSPPPPPPLLSNASSFGSAIWPGGSTTVPTGSFPKSTAPLLIAVPNKKGYRQFVYVGEGAANSSLSNERFTGFCIDVFKAAVALLPYSLQYRFVAVGDGVDDPSYTAIVQMVANKTFDGAVGDITITENRAQIVDFTQPYEASGLAMVVPTQKYEADPWAFLKPLTPTMWLLIGVSFLYAAFVVWFLEHLQNDEFGGKVHQQIANSLWFSFATMSFAQEAGVKTTLGRISVIVWLFVVFVISSAYTASLTSVLTVLQIKPTIKDLQALIASTSVNVGFQQGSFTESYLVQLGIDRDRLVALRSEAEYDEVMSKGKVGAVVDEEPYLDIFLSDFCGYTKSSSAFAPFNFGFAFQKGSTLAGDLSVAIEALAQNGQLQGLHDLWLHGGGSCSTGPTLQSNRLGPDAFWGLFLLYGSVAIICCVAYAVLLIYRGLKAFREEGDVSLAPEESSRAPTRLKSHIQRYKNAYEAGKEWSLSKQQSGSARAGGSFSGIQTSHSHSSSGSFQQRAGGSGSDALGSMNLPSSWTEREDARGKFSPTPQAEIELAGNSGPALSVGGRGSSRRLPPSRFSRGADLNEADNSVRVDGEA